MENTLQQVAQVAKELAVDESAAYQQARGLAAWPEKNLDWYGKCGNYLRELKAAEKLVDEKIGPIAETQYKAWKMTRDLINSLVKPRKECRAIVSLAMGLWKNEEDARRKEQAEADTLLMKQRDEAARLAVATDAGVNPVFAAALLDNSFVLPVLPVEVKLDGIKHKKKWRVRCVNKRDLLHAVVKDPALMDALKVDLSWLEARAQESNGTLVIPGIELDVEDVVDVR